MLTSLRKHPVIFVAAILVAGLLAWGFWPQPVLVEAVFVKRAPMAVTIEEEGRTRVADRYVVSAPVDGVTCRVQLEVGDSVEKGQILLSISAPESQILDPRSRERAKSAVAAAESSLRSAEEEAAAAAAAERLATIELKRLKPLLAKGLIAQDQYDAALTEVTTTAAMKRSANSRIDVAGYELEAARTLLAYTAGSLPPAERVTVRSPVRGRVLKVIRECEGPVRTGEPLAEIGDPSRLEVEVDVLSADAVRIGPGMKVLFDRWGGERPLEGVVRTVEPVGFTKVSALGVEEQRVLVICDFTSPGEEWNRLGDGYRVEAQFIVWEDPSVLQVPAGTLFRHEEGWAVFAVEGGRAKRRAVTLGQRNGLAAQILTNLTEGERVISHPSDRIEDGVRIKLR